MTEFRTEVLSEVELTKKEYRIMYDISEEDGLECNEVIGKALIVYSRLREFVSGK